MHTAFEVLRRIIITLIDLMIVIGEAPEMARELRLHLASFYALARRLDTRPA